MCYYCNNTMKRLDITREQRYKSTQASLHEYTAAPHRTVQKAIIVLFATNCGTITRTDTTTEGAIIYIVNTPSLGSVKAINGFMIHGYIGQK